MMIPNYLNSPDKRTLPVASHSQCIFRIAATLSPTSDPFVCRRLGNSKGLSTPDCHRSAVGSSLSRRATLRLDSVKQSGLVNFQLRVNPPTLTCKWRFCSAAIRPLALPPEDEGDGCPESDLRTNFSISCWCWNCCC